jgi:hypothetical protein
MGIENIEMLSGDDNVPDHDATDVPLVIATKDDDGPGFVTTPDELPPSDFVEEDNK